MSESAVVLPFPARRRFHPAAATAAVVITVALAVPFVTRSKSEWDEVYVPTAAHLLAGDDIYAQPHGYTYPPLQALFAVPVVGLPRPVQRLAWFAVNAVAFAIMMRAAVQLAGGSVLHTHRGRVQFGLGVFAGLCFAFNAFSHQQTDLVLGACVLGGCNLFARGRWKGGAAAVGFAAAMKCTPLLFVAYLLARGRIAAAGVLVAAALGASLLPDAVAMRPGGGTWLAAWADRYLLPMANPDYTPGVWASEIVYNQSFVGAANRWTTTTWQPAGKSAAILPVEPSASPAELKRVLLALAAACGTLGFAGLVLARRRGIPDPPRVAYECSVVIAGTLLFSPMSSAAHFGLLLLPGLALSRAVFADGRVWAIVPLAGMVAGAALGNKDVWGAKVYTIGLWYGSAMFAAVAALVGGLAGLAFTRPAAAEVAPAVRQAA